MGGVFTALIENTIGELKNHETTSKPKPGVIRLAARKFRNTVVVGKGRALLPEPVGDDSFDPHDKELEKRESTFAEKLKARNSSIPPSTGSEAGAKKKRVRRIYHKRLEEEELTKLAPIRASLSRSKSISAGVAGARQSIIKMDADMRVQRLEKQKKDRQQLEHKRRIEEAKGCRGRLNEVAFLILIFLYVLITIWSVAMHLYILDSATLKQYDYANDVWFEINCNMDLEKLKLWWRMNAIFTGMMLTLVVSIEVFYWFIAPYSPKAALSAFSRTFSRNFIFILWLLLVVIWLIIGSIWFFEAKRKLCGTMQVDHARGLLIVQYSWLTFHMLLFTSDFDNRMAIKRLWCLEAEVKTVLYCPNDAERQQALDASDCSDYCSEMDEYKEDEDNDTLPRTEDEAVLNDDDHLNNTITISLRRPSVGGGVHQLTIPAGLNNEEVVGHITEAFQDPSNSVKVLSITNKENVHVEPSLVQHGKLYNVVTQ
eukprot:TRINITY_DN12626_c0_g1_i1.p1 TRINITY_DN12626_c0_g1~~TRINITY_DN12626_c0_g1_i1.p1  ORF type:complete len:507 (+),score=97.99 TRINITY_DN12626_c0_g1_i1:71-1522(+)